MDKDQKKPLRILFICLGNICRSPAAEGVLRQMAQERGLEHELVIDSAGLGNWHTGDLPDRRMRQHASQRGYNLTHRARQIKGVDFCDFDLIIGMDDENLRALRRMAPTPEARDKISCMVDYSTLRPRPASVPDPYYGTGKDFDYALDLIEDACSGLLDSLTHK